jgi:hypothetical protein
VEAERGLLVSRGEWITAHSVALQSYDLAVRLPLPQMIVASSTRQALAEDAMDDLDAALSSARRDRLATPLSEPPARALPPAELLAQLKRVAQVFAFDQARLAIASRTVSSSFD